MTHARVRALERICLQRQKDIHYWFDSPFGGRASWSYFFKFFFKHKIEFAFIIHFSKLGVSKNRSAPLQERQESGLRDARDIIRIEKFFLNGEQSVLM